MASTRDAGRLILASASTSRAALLRAAGIDFVIEPADIDESAIKNEFRVAGHAAMTCAQALAEAKAKTIAARHPDALVVGADQLLVAGEEWFDKPHDLAEAATQLRRLRGREHVLATACCVCHGETVLWQTTVAPKLAMRPFSDGFLAAYIVAEGDVLLGSVGAYRLEGRGAQLFARIEGDHFAILGLPLLELLAFLRGQDIVGE